VFWADAGLDTGPVLLQRECAVEPNDTVDALYNRFLFPEGIKAMASNWDSINSDERLNSEVFYQHALKQNL